MIAPSQFKRRVFITQMSAHAHALTISVSIMYDAILMTSSTPANASDKEQASAVPMHGFHIRTPRSVHDLAD